MTTWMHSFICFVHFSLHQVHQHVGGWYQMCVEWTSTYLSCFYDPHSSHGRRTRRRRIKIITCNILYANSVIYLFLCRIKNWLVWWGRWNWRENNCFSPWEIFCESSCLWMGRSIETQLCNFFLSNFPWRRRHGDFCLHNRLSFEFSLSLICLWCDLVTSNERGTMTTRSLTTIKSVRLFTYRMGTVAAQREERFLILLLTENVKRVFWYIFFCTSEELSRDQQKMSWMKFFIILRFTVWKFNDIFLILPSKWHHKIHHEKILFFYFTAESKIVVDFAGILSRSYKFNDQFGTCYF